MIYLRLTSELFKNILLIEITYPSSFVDISAHTAIEWGLPRVVFFAKGAYEFINKARSIAKRLNFKNFLFNSRFSGFFEQ